MYSLTSTEFCLALEAFTLFKERFIELESSTVKDCYGGILSGIEEKALTAETVPTMVT